MGNNVAPSSSNQPYITHSLAAISSTLPFCNHVLPSNTGRFFAFFFKEKPSSPCSGLIIIWDTQSMKRAKYFMNLASTGCFSFDDSLFAFLEPSCGMTLHVYETTSWEKAAAVAKLSSGRYDTLLETS